MAKQNRSVASITKRLTKHIKRGGPASPTVIPRATFTTSVNGKAIAFHIRYVVLPKWAQVFWRLCILGVAVVIMVTIIIPTISARLAGKSYALTSAESALLPQPSPSLQKQITHNTKQAAYIFNAKASTTAVASGQQLSYGGASSMMSATIPDDPTKGVTIDDPINSLSLTVTPKFALAAARQDSSHIYYPFNYGGGQLVYSPQATALKEDITLNRASGNTMHFDYGLSLPDGTAARVQKDGSIGVFGADLPVLNNISTDNAKDQALVQKAKQHAAKTKLLFTIPAPSVRETNHGHSVVKASFSLLDGGQTVRLTATNLSKANFPVALDPTVSVNSISQLYRDTNAESNVDFDATDGTINRGAVTGGIIGPWTTNSTSLATARFLSSSTVSNGYVYAAGGTTGTGTSNTATVEYAQITTTSPYTIGTWSTTTSLPAALSRFKLLAYNGFIYAVAGSVTNSTCATNQATVYYNATLPNGALSSSWSTASHGLPAALCGMGATVYNGKIYAAGGRTGSSGTTGSVTSVYYASILPNGDLSSWTTTSTVLPVAIFDGNLVAYNGYLYFMGGNNNGTLVTTSYYAALASDGSIYGSSSAAWRTTSPLGGARSSFGSEYITVNDGFMYSSGGCVGLGANQNCSSVSNNIQLAQINADGSLGTWYVVQNAVNGSLTPSWNDVGGSLLAWQGTLFEVAGCSAMNTTGVSCASGDILASQVYSAIVGAGELGPAQTNTNVLPNAVYGQGAVVNNGYLYVIGGCIFASTTQACESTTSADTTGNTSYAPINADGSIGTWTTDSTTAHLLNNTGTLRTSGLAAFGIAVYHNVIYVVGGYNQALGTSGTRNAWYVGLNANGSLTGAWTTVANALPAALYYNSAVIEHGVMYSIGGCTASAGQAGCSSYKTTVSKATLTAGGAVSTFSATGMTALPTGKALMAASLYNNYVYLAGGATGSAAQTDDIYYGKIQSNGTITSWNTAHGSLVNTLRRADGYAINGYLYVFGGHDASVPTTYPFIEICKIDLSSGDIDNNCAYSTAEITGRWDSRVAYADGYIYDTGGCLGTGTSSPAAACQNISNDVQYFSIFNAGNDGTGSWSTSSNNYSSNWVGASSVAYNGYIYFAGGCGAYTFSALGPCSSNSDAVSYATLNPDGSMGTWTNLSAALGTAPTTGGTEYGCMLAANGYLYYIGGGNSSNVPRNEVYISHIGANGVPGAWSLGTVLPGNRAHVGCDSFDGTLYVAGGTSSSTSTTEGTDQATVYYTQPNASTGAISSWSTGTSFTTARRDASVVATGGYLYIIGGYSNGGTATYYSDVQYDDITPATGALGGTWTITRSLPNLLTQASATAANGYIFVSGGAWGATTTTCTGNTYIAPINNTGEVGSWTAGVNDLPTPLFGATGAYYNGYYYVMGGYACGSSAIISSNPIHYGGEQSQSMNSFFTRYADLGGNALPEVFVAYVTNAQINSVDIEDWKLVYATSSAANNAWGVSTAINPIVSQAVTHVNAYDGSGTNIKLARWVDLSFSISMEKSFTFTDDTQPTVSGYGLYYSPDPVTRLRNGKDFQDQQQQGFDLNLQ